MPLNVPTERLSRLGGRLCNGISKMVKFSALSEPHLPSVPEWPGAVNGSIRTHFVGDFLLGP